MKPRLALLPLFGLLLALSLGCGSTAQAANNMEVAIQDDNVFLGKPSALDLGKGLDLSRELFVTRIRANVIWEEVVGADVAKLKKAPKTIDYRWAPIDHLIDRAALRGIRVQLTLTGPAPRYAAAGRFKRKWIVKPSAAKFAAFARAAAEHFKGGRVNRYSIWNEPNHVSWLRPKRSAPQIYRKLYEAGYKAIKSADSKAEILIAETSPYGHKNATPPLAFLRSVACVNARYEKTKNCKPLVADGYAHHPYDFRAAPNRVSNVARGRDNATLAQIGNLTTALNKLAKVRALRTKKGRALDLYLTEFGYFAPGSKKYSLGESTRTKHLVNAFKLAQKNPRVKQLLQYVLVTPPKDQRFFDLSLITLEGERTKPFTKLVSWGNGAKIKKPGGPITLPPPNVP